MSLEGWKDFFEIGGLILLAFTVVFGGGALYVNKRLNIEQALQLQTFNIELTAANAKVEGLRGDNLRLEAKALSLQKELLAQGPRANLLANEETRRELVDALKPFAGQKIDVQCELRLRDSLETGDVPGFGETVELAKSVISVLNDAHWDAPKVLSGTRSRLHGHGISVHIPQNASPSVHKIAEALVKALGGVPFAVSGPSPDSPDPAEIIVVTHIR
jgi:hypothetical protein